MPRFLIPIIILTIVFTITFLIILNLFSPFSITENNQILTLDHPHIILFLGSAFFTLFFSLTLILYLTYRLVGDPVKQRSTIRRSIRQGFLISLGITTSAILQLTHTLNPLTLILTAAVIVTLEATLRNTP